MSFGYHVKSLIYRETKANITTMDRYACIKRIFEIFGWFNRHIRIAMYIIGHGTAECLWAYVYYHVMRKRNGIPEQKRMIVWVIIVYATMLCYQAFFRSYSRANVRGILSIENCDSRKHANATNISEHVKLTSLVSIIYLYAHVLIEILPPFLFCSTEQS